MTNLKDEAASPLSLRQLLAPTEVARILGITVSTLAVWRCRRRYPLPYIKIGSRVRYRQADVDKFIAEQGRAR